MYARRIRLRTDCVGKRGVGIPVIASGALERSIISPMFGRGRQTLLSLRAFSLRHFERAFAQEELQRPACL